MNYNDLINDERFQRWFQFEPKEVQYLKYSETTPSLIAAGHKITDVYYAFAEAHSSFGLAGLESYGPICSNDEVSVLYTKSHFLRTALIEYAICLDLSWQVIWAYIQPSSLEYLFNQKYKDMEKKCTRDNVKEQLDCLIAQKGTDYNVAIKLKKIFLDFDEDPDVEKFRTVYNSVKHHGVLHIDGLGCNNTEILFTINDKSFPMLHRKTYSIVDLEEMLKVYNDKFIVYMDSIVDLIIPDDYLDNRFELEDVFFTLKAINDIKR